MSDAGEDARGGFLLLDKPRGVSSFQALNPLKRLFRGRRVGHAGTLDPAASGLLLAGIGSGTRLLEFLEGRPKTYTFLARFGLVSDTYDMEGAVTGAPAAGLSREEVERALPAFRGRIRQAPPAYSAVKVDGRRAYSLARAGETVTLEAREVEVSELDLLAFEAGVAALRMTCSKGTYVRSLVHDLGRALGCGAVADDIRRTAIGPFRVEDALTLSALSPLAAGASTSPTSSDSPDSPASPASPTDPVRSGAGNGPVRRADPPPLLPLEAAVAHLPAAVLPAHRLAALRDGRSTAMGQYELRPAGEASDAALPPEGGDLQVLGPDGRLLAIATLDAGGNLCPRKVLPGP